MKENKKEKIRKMYYDALPRWESGANKYQINWTASIGEKAKFNYEGTIGEVEIIDYNEKHLYIKYLDYPIYKIKTSNFKLCQLGGLLGVITSEFKIEIGDTFKDDKRDLTIIDRKYKPITRKNNKTENEKWYKYKCNKCGFDGGEHYKNCEYKEEFWIEESGLLNGNGCACCCLSSNITVPHINSIVANEETYWMIKYFQGGYDEAKRYTPKSDRRVEVKCPDCGRIKDKKRIADIYKTHSIGCSCSDGQTYPEKFMFNILEQLDIEFIKQLNKTTFNWCDKYRYDFYIPSLNLIIEMDGGLGHGKTTHSKSNKSVKETKVDDDYKDKLAEEHGIKVIRINCDESNLDYIKDNVLKGELMDCFDFDNVNWLMVEEFALSNRVKEACEYKKNNPNRTCNDIGKIMNLDTSTIIKYLKKGTKLGWCEYDPKEELAKKCSRNNKKRSKKIKMFKNNILLGIFESAAELERQSEKLFGVKLDSSTMYMVANGKRNKHKGYYFKYA